MEAKRSQHLGKQTGGEAEPRLGGFRGQGCEGKEGTGVAIVVQEHSTAAENEVFPHIPEIRLRFRLLRFVLDLCGRCEPKVRDAGVG